ncbi:MAG: hypothetical protein GF392_00445, partial [Candidatus Omnitrophica bacterium]|nr:hypothetical protein [Candidatus Omnitrophota bacterium]
MKLITRSTIISSLFIFGLTAGDGRPVFAGNPSRAMDLGTVTVTRDEMAVGIRGEGATGKGEIGKPRSSRAVDGLLTEVAGVDVKRTSPAGNSGSEVLLRGFDESRY